MAHRCTRKFAGWDRGGGWRLGDEMQCEGDRFCGGVKSASSKSTVRAHRAPLSRQTNLISYWADLFFVATSGHSQCVGVSTMESTVLSHACTP